MNEPLQTSGSLRRRLMLQLVGSAAFLATLLFFVVLGFARDVAQQTHDSILLASATSIMDSVSVQADEITVDIPYAALSMLGNVSNDRVFYRVSTRDDVLTGYENLPTTSQSVRSGHSAFDTLTYKGDSIRMVTSLRRLSLNGAPADIIISVAQTREGQAAQLAQLSRSAMQLGLGFFLVATILAIWAAQSSIRPLKQLTEAVSRRGPKDLRPVQRPVPSEMIPLVSSLNRFIGRLRVSLTRSEDFIAEAAHRVRTPLATVRTQAEITLRRVDRAENRASLREMIRAIDESSRAAGQLLDHAMVTFRIDSLERKAIDLTELGRELVDRLQPIAELKDIDLHFFGSGNPKITGDAILIQNAVRNILDNAIKYSPNESAIQVSTRQNGNTARIQVEDEAGGFVGMDTDALTQRFTRGENAAGTIGSGLGLTIAREVVEAHGGVLIIETSKTGTGACVSLCFPLH
ncbi:sensor histidine kinase [Parasedimentitalea huanghaiensis]|uniref:histidine kinase n=1 Tax=Parasedimentitalea huanghaiensis TaxID=2682100 RepID=A0A6L6WHG0_9RHOB|nr:sensor histidine kinase [Zongyanglinia huanghaiensis]MVO16678.1 HAMP domain-containing protein [Zongyanglinia huanghaiensis]